MQAVMSQAVILDPYARAVMRKTAERIRSLGEEKYPESFSWAWTSTNKHPGVLIHLGHNKDVNCILRERHDLRLGSKLPRR